MKIIKFNLILYILICLLFSQFMTFADEEEWDGTFPFETIYSNLSSKVDASNAKIDNGQAAWLVNDGNDDELYFWDGSSYRRITNNDYDIINYDLDNGQLVWYCEDGNDYEIFFWDGSDTYQITNNTINDRAPKLDNNQITWYAYDGNDYEVFFWNGSETIQLTDNDFSDSSPLINNGQVIWTVGKGSYFELYLWDGNEVKIISDNIISDSTFLSKSFLNGKIAWSGYDGNDYEIFLWNGTEIIQVTDNDYNDASPDIDENLIVWTYNDGTNREICIWDGTEIKQITNTEDNNNNLDVKNGIITYWNYWDIYLWNADKTHRLTYLDNNPHSFPKTDGDFVLWYEDYVYREGSSYSYMTDIKYCKLDWKEPVLELITVDEYDNEVTGWTNANEVYVKAVISESDFGIPSGIDKESIFCLINQQSILDCSYEEITGDGIEFSNEGGLLLRVFIQDNAGNTAAGIIDIKIDRTDPVITINEPDVQDDSVFVSAGAEDNLSGINETSWSIAVSEYDEYGGLEYKYTENASSITIEEEGNYYLEFKVYDNAGNYTTGTTEVIVDTTGPYLTGYLFNGEPGDPDKWYKGPVTVFPLFQDDGIGVDPERIYRVEYSPYIIGDPEDPEIIIEYYPADTTIAAIEAIHNLTFIAYDYYNNESEDYVINLKIDNTPPEIIFTKTPDLTNWTNDNSLILGIEASDALSGLSGLYYHKGITGDGFDPETAEDTDWISIDNNGEITGFPQGANKVWVKAVDNAGNETISSTIYQLDYTPPVITFPSEGTWINETVSFVLEDTLSGIDAYTVKYKIDDGEYESGNEISFVETGIYEVTAVAGDVAGNQAEVTKTVKVDMTPPVITIDIEKNGSLAVITGSAYDEGRSGVNEDSWEYVINDGDALTGNQVEITEPGNHTVTFTVEDVLGNISSESVTINIDNKPPEITASGCDWNTNEINTASASAVDQGGSGLDPDSWFYQLNTDQGAWLKINDTLENGSAVEVGISNEGETIVYFKVSDLSGNSSIASTYVRKDTTAPSYSDCIFTSSDGAVEQEGDTNKWVNYQSINIQSVYEDENGCGLQDVYYSFDETLDISEWIKSDNVTITNEGITNVYFKADDILGSLSPVKSLTARIDRTIPSIIKGNLLNQYVTDTLTFDILPSGQDENDIDEGSLVYSIDDTYNWQAFSDSINISSLDEGQHTLYTAISDYAGNTVIDETGYEFYVDRTGPVVNNIEILNVETIINEDAYCPVNSVKANITSSEQAAGYYYLLSGIMPDNPQLTEYIESSTDFYLNNLSEGINYLYLKAVDFAGNTSANLFERKILVDTVIPGKPGIKGLSHPQADQVEDAVSFKDACFRMSVPETGQSGFIRFHYELKQGLTLESSETVMQGEDTDTQIEFINLDDNLENEFYFLLVNAVSGNGLSGDNAVYKFRIDSNPPEHLKIVSSSHANPGVYYPYDYAQFHWNKPVDFTGVKFYYYLASSDKILPETIDENTVIDISTWEPGTINNFSLNLKEIVDSNAGLVYFAVCAEDYAGNKEYDETYVSFDTEKPVLPGDITVSVVQETQEASVEWQEPADNIEVSHIEIRIAVYENQSFDYLTNWVSVSNSVNDFTWDGLDTDENIVYTVLLRVIDTAGNEQTYIQGFSFSGEPVNVDFVIPFIDYVNGYKITGNYSENTSLQNAFIEIPEVFNFTADDLIENKVELENPVFTGESFEQGENPSVEYNINLADYTFTGNGIKFTRDYGLSFDKLEYQFFIDTGEYKTMISEDVSITSPPQVMFKKITSTVDEPFGVYTYRAPEEDEIPEEAGWHFVNITVTGLEGIYIYLNSCDLYLQEYSDLIHAYTLQDDEKQFVLSAEDIAISPEAFTVSGNITDEFYLEAGNNKYFVKNAIIDKNKIIILKANLLLGENYITNPDTIVINNFSIDINGNISKENGFFITPFSFEYNNYTYNVNNAGFINNSLVITDGYMTTANGDIDIKNLVIEQDELNYDNNIEFGSFDHDYSGFRVTSTSGIIIEDKIYFPEADVQMPGAFGGAKQEINDFTISIDDYDLILQAGSGNVDFTITSGYGEDAINIKKITLDSNGLKADSALIKLPGFIETPANIEFTDLTLFSDGITGNAVSANSQDFTIQGFSLTVNNIIFNNEKITFGEIKVSLADSYTPADLTFTGLTVTSSSIIEAGISDITVECAFNEKWSVVLKDIIIDDTGIHGIGEVQLGEVFENSILICENFYLKSDSSFDSGSISGAELVIKDWLVTTNDLSLTENNIILNEAVISLLDEMGEDEFIIPDVIVDFEGNLISSGISNDIVNFTSCNGFYVESTQALFTENGLFLSGKIYFPGLLGENVYTEFNKTIQLDGFGNVLTPEIEVITSCTYNGWNIDVIKLSFVEEGLILLESNFKLWDTGKLLELPEIQFYSDGTIKPVKTAVEDCSFDYKGFNFEVTDVILTEDSLNINAFVSLPGSLGGEGLLFDPITLNSDGTFSTDVTIPEFSFNIFDVEFHLSEIGFEESGFTIETMVITLPAENFDNKSFKLEDIMISYDGTIQTGNSYSFDLWGYVFNVENIGVSNNILSIEGTVTLPDDFFMEDFRGLLIDINEFSISLETGEIIDFSVTFDEQFSFNLFDTWEIQVETLTLEPGKIKFAQGWLILPEDFAISNILINDIVIDLENQDISLGVIDLSTLESIEYSGMIFKLNSLEISSDRGLVFSGFVDFTEQFPGIFEDLRLNIDVFQIKPDYTLGDITASVDNISTELFGGSMYLYNCSIGFKYVDDDLYLSLSEGLLEFLDDFPQGIAGTKLNVNRIEIRAIDGKITEFDAGLTDINFNLFEAVEIDAEEINVILNDDNDFKINITGDVIINNGFHESLNELVLDIEEFVVSSSGDIESFKAGMNFENEVSLWGNIKLLEGSVNAGLGEDSSNVIFETTGKLKLGSDFAEGTELDIQKLKFDSSGNILELEAYKSLTNMNIYDDLYFNNGFIELVKENGEILMSITGEFKFPSNFPDGLKDLPVTVDEFTVNSEGEIVNFKVKTENVNFTIWDAVTVINADIVVTKDSSEDDNGLIFDFTGDIDLPGDIESGFNNVDFKINKLKLSTKNGLLDFEAGTTGSIERVLFADIIINCSSIMLTMNGVKINDANLFFPEDFPEGLKDNPLELSSFEMNWNGDITNIEAGLDEYEIKLAGFRTKINDLVVHEDKITIAKCEVFLPEDMNAGSLFIEDAYFDYEGVFHGEFGVSNINMDIASFQVDIEDPYLDVEGKKIGFSKAVIKLPDLLDDAVYTLNNVSIKPDGISLGGAGFRLPNFSIGDGLGFRDLYAEFKFSDGYYVEASGKAIVPGAGTFEALISFAEKSDTYPIGLKRAFFSYTIYGIGLPIGNTGLYINQIRGGLAYGPPDEVPAKVRGLFSDNGTRISIGLTMVDGKGGSIIKGDVDTWIDIEKGSWAFQGRVSVLSGIVKSDLIAAYGKNIFYGGLNVDLKFVDGQVELYIFTKNGRTLINGSGKMKFKIPRGCIINKRIKIGFVKIRIRVPRKTYNLGGISAQFGTFTNGKKGVKGSVRLPVIGTYGVFVGSKFDIGKLKGYELEKPDELRAQLKLVSLSLYNMPYPTYDNSSHKYYFNVQGDAYGIANASYSNEIGPVTETERLIFGLYYTEGLPLVTIVSPSGVSYSPGDDNVEVEYLEYGMMFSVVDPEPGQWNVIVDNVTSAEDYYIEVYSKGKMPEIILDPIDTTTISNNSLVVTGNASKFDGSNANVIIYLSEDYDTYFGRDIGSVTTDENGDFIFECDTTSIESGTYYLFAGIEEDDDDPEIRIYANEAIVIDNTDIQLQPVDNLVVTDNEDNSIDVNFSDPNGTRTTGFNLYINNLTEQKEEKIKLGYLTEITIPGFNREDQLEVYIKAYDEANNEGLSSEIKTIIIGEEKEIINEFSIVNDLQDVELYINSEYSDSLNIQADNTTQTNSGYDYIKVNVSEITFEDNTSDALSVGFDKMIWNIAENDNIINYYLYADDAAEPGEYNVKLYIYNCANEGNYKEAVINVSLKYQEIALNNIFPEEFVINESAEIDIDGENFFDGTRVFLNDDELTIIEADLYNIKADILPGTAGTQVLSIVGVDGSTISREISVIAPGYEIVGLQTMVDAFPGGSCELSFTIKGENDYNSTATFVLGNVPEGFNAILHDGTIGIDDTALISIDISSDTAAGEYIFDVIGDNGEILYVCVNVTDDVIGPNISYLSPDKIFTGDLVTIYGYGFGEEGIVMMNDTELEIVSYSDTEIVVNTAGIIDSGNILVCNDISYSNEKMLYIKQEGYTIYPETGTVELRPGESTVINLMVNGYMKNPVSLYFCDNSNSGINGAYNITSLIPNGVVQMTVSVNDTKMPGIYEIYAIGYYNGEKIYVPISVVVKEPFDWITAGLPDGTVCTEYNYSLLTTNPEDIHYFEIVDGSLPGGLELSSDGIISGIIEQEGEFVFKVKAVSLDEEVITKEFTINSFKIIDTDHILYMDFNNNILDYSGNDYEIEWNGEEKYSEGIAGQALDLSVADDNYVVVKHSDELASMDQLHVSVWARKNDETIGGDVIRKHIHYRLAVYENGVYAYVNTENGIGIINKYGLQAEITNTDWHHYELIYDGEQVILYIDGVEITSIAHTGTIINDSSRDLYIGKDPWGDSFDGQIDNLEIKNNTP